MPSYIFDCETNGLLHELDRLHSLVIRDADTGELVGSYADQEGYPSILEGISVLLRADRLYAHNAPFDTGAIEKVYPDVRLDRERVLCTHKSAAMRWTNLKVLDKKRLEKGFPGDLVGKHSLKAWGVRLGEHKGDYTGGWEKWSKEMQDYCEQDTLTTYALVRHLRKHGVTLEASETEAAVAFYLDQQERDGWPFDVEGAAKLQGEWAARREDISQELIALFGCWSKPKKRTASGAPEVRVSKTRRHIKGPGGLKLTLGAGIESTPIEWVQFNPASRQHIAKVLKERYGWQPTSFTEGGQPEVNEKTLEALDQSLPGVSLFGEYLLIEKMLGQLAEGKKAWLRFAKKNPITGLYHLHGRVMQSGTVTHRASHSDPNVAQVPKVGSPFGEECRALFGVPNGWVQVGADASGIQLRNLAHYMAKWDDGAYGQVIIAGKNEDGTDIHSVNRNALGMDGKQGRDDAKTFIYTYLFGGGDLLLGTRVPPKPEDLDVYRADTKGRNRVKNSLTKRRLPTNGRTIAASMHGSALRSRFEKNLPALGKLTDAVKKRAKALGYLELPEGRRVPVEHQHTALNYLLQGAEAVICKRWIRAFSKRLTEELGPQGWTGNWVALGWVHDEVQLATRPQYAEQVKVILLEEIRALTDVFKWRVPIDGEVKFGRNWKETH